MVILRFSGIGGSSLRPGEFIDFELLPGPVNSLLQRGVDLRRSDADAADALFRQALDLDPKALPAYACLYRTNLLRWRLDDALRYASAGLAEAARQAGLASDWRTWTRADIDSLATRRADKAAHFALVTLKSLAMIYLRRDAVAQARAALAKLAELRMLRAVGGEPIAALVAELDGAAAPISDAVGPTTPAPTSPARATPLAWAVADDGFPRAAVKAFAINFLWR